MTNNMANKKNPSIKKNYLYNLTYTLLNTALPLFTAPYLARVLGVDGTGLYAYYYSIAHMFFIFAKLGLNNYGTREISKVRNTDHLSRVFCEIYYQQLLVSVFVNIVYGIYCVSFVKQPDEKIYAFILWLYVFSSLFDIDWLYSGLENFKLIATRNIIVKIVTVVLIFCFVKSSDDLWLYTLAMSFGYSFGYIYNWIKVRKYIRFEKVKLNNILKHLKPNFILMIPTLALSVYHYIDKIMLGSMVGMIAIGLYDNAEKIIYALTGFINSFGTIMMPRMTYIIASGEQKQNDLYLKRSIQFMMFLMFGMAFGLLAISNKLVVTIFGTEFIAAGPILSALAFTLPATGWSNVIRTQYVVPSGYDNIFIYTITTGALIDLAVNIILIPIYGIKGAVIGTICAEYSVVIAQFLFLRKKLNYMELIKSSLFAPVCGIIMYLIVKTIPSFISGSINAMIIQIIVGVISYFVLVGLYFFIFEKEIADAILHTIKND